MKKHVCAVCGYEYIGDVGPERCPICKAPGNRFSEKIAGSRNNGVNYYYIDANNNQAGPVSPAEFGKYGINRNTIVWRQGMVNWLAANQLPELSSYFAQESVGINMQQHDSNARRQQTVNTQQKPDNFMVWAILATIFCCLATGIAAIVEANRVDNYWYAGKYQESIKAMNDARKWTFISLGIGIFGFLSLMLFGPLGWLFFQLLLLTLYLVYNFITGIGAGASPLFASLLWIGGIIFLCWFIPILFNFCF